MEPVPLQKWDTSLKRVMDDSGDLEQQLYEHFTRQQVMDMILLHGLYNTIACMIKTRGLELDPHVAKRLPDTVTENSF